jgi:hypothetical protein
VNSTAVLHGERVGLGLHVSAASRFEDTLVVDFADRLADVDIDENGQWLIPLELRRPQCGFFCVGLNLRIWLWFKAA